MIRFNTDRNIRLPTKMHLTDAGYDCYLPEKVNINAKSLILINLGISINLNEDEVAFVCFRSSISKFGLIGNQIPIDSGYKGEIHLIGYNPTDNNYTFEKDTRICQIVILKIPVEYGLDNIRNKGGFGSSGR